jgi:polysaccharide pyruvyl transferase WcaK-like protein
MLGFDFVGAGNIGDDLMVAGFLDAIAALRPRFWPRLYGACAHNVLSQRKRFGQILWNPRARPDVDCWAGVGGTPFQTTCGDWMLDFFQRELPRTRNIPRRVLVAIGVEGEIESRRGEYSAVAQEFQHISTRDEFSRAILVERLGVPEARVMAGADLANLSLARLFADTTPPKKEYRLGLTLAGDTLSPQDFCEIEKFLASRTHPVAFIACETRLASYFERGIHPRLAARLPAGRLDIRFCQYSDDDLTEMVRPIAECETVISGRYHGLLAAAWAGCKVAAIGRSSKLTALAAELEVPIAPLPLDHCRLAELTGEAVVVRRDILRRMESRVSRAVAFSLAGG